MLRRIFLIITIFLSLTILSGYLYVKNSWKEFTSKEKIVELTDSIKKAKHLPELFYKLYESNNPSALKCNHKRLVIESIAKGRYEAPPSNQSAKMVGILFEDFKGMNNQRLNLKYHEFSLTWQIEKYTTQRQCLNWIAENYDYFYSNTGIFNASRYYYDKPIESLNKLEMAELVIMMKNSSLYNPKRNGELLKEKATLLVKEYDIKIEE